VGIARLAEAVLIAGVSFGCGTVLSAAVLAWLAGALHPWVSAVALVVGAVAAVVAAPQARANDEPWTPWQWAALAAFALVSLRQFLWLVFERDGTLLTLLPHNYGDLPLHWTYVQQLASGARFWPENPILTHARLRYPIGVDLLTAAVVSLGPGLPLVLKAIGLVGSLLAALALRRWGGAFAVAGFLFCGGLVGIPSLVSGRLVDVDGQVAWKNLYLALLVPQRGFLLALPAGLVLLSSWRDRLLRNERGLPRWVETLLWSALPLVHLHTFAFVSVVFAVWTAASGRWREGFASVGKALVPAAWGVLLVTGIPGAGGTGRLVGWAPGWAIGDQSPALFLARNFGFWLPLAAAALVLGAWTRRREALLLLVPSLALFGLLFLVRVAPWAWDNTKVMLWCLVTMLPALDGLVLARLRPALRAAALVLLFTSGLASVLWACVARLPRLEVLTLAEYAGVCEALARTPTTRVATYPTFNHPVALCGRPLVAGYAGHLWSHGLDSSRVEEQLKRLMQGDAGWREEAAALGASHVFWGAREIAAFPASTRPWEALGPPAASGDWGALYRLD
jgi:hypothetical protein